MAKATTTTDTSKWARLRQVAQEEPKEADAALTELAEGLGTLADSLTNLRDHLDLLEAPKTASVRARIAAARKYAASFRRLAEEAPEVIADALVQGYHSLDDIAGGYEALAERMGVDLHETPVEKAFAEEGEEEAEGDIPEEKEITEESKEASTKTAGPLAEKFVPENAALTENGPLGILRKLIYSLDGSENPHQVLGLIKQKLNDAKVAGEFAEKFTPEDASLTNTGWLGALRKLLYSMDGSENKYQIIEAVDKTLKGQPEGQSIAASTKKADGSAAFVSDRNENGEPEAPAKVEIPEAQGSSEENKSASRRAVTAQRIAKRHGIEL